MQSCWNLKGDEPRNVWQFKESSWPEISLTLPTCPTAHRLPSEMKLSLYEHRSKDYDVQTTYYLLSWHICVPVVSEGEKWKIIKSFSIESFFCIFAAATSIQWGSCGLNGEAAVRVTSEGQDCNGTLTDWNERSCHPRSKLTLESVNCPHFQLIGKSKWKPIFLVLFKFPSSSHFNCASSTRETSIYASVTSFVFAEFICIALVLVDDTRKVLITQESDGQRLYNCWVGDVSRSFTIRHNKFFLVPQFCFKISWFSWPKFESIIDQYFMKNQGAVFMARDRKRGGIMSSDYLLNFAQGHGFPMLLPAIRKTLVAKLRTMENKGDWCLLINPIHFNTIDWNQYLRGQQTINVW